ncbi:acyltransferase [Micromonospora sp. NPDC049523]|uniref:acyltransferase family protein n=1 Tax=Micromonospora sp. NPDC049523 TaxID=3155921 RepID=UPI00343E56FC
MSDATVELPRQDAVPSKQVVEKAVSRPRGGGRLYVLDLLRFVAALMVFAYHTLNAYQWGGELDRDSLVWYGWLGVQLFFIISGFVICMSSWGRTLSEFFTSRAVRLLPAYVVAVLLTSTVLLIWPTPEGSPRSLDVLANLTMLQGFMDLPNIDPVYWSLLVEVKFYLIFAIVVHAGVTYRRVVLFCAVWLTASLLAQAGKSDLLTAIVEPRFASYFVAGIALYLMHRFGPNLLLWGMLGTCWVLCAISLHGQVALGVSFGEPVRFHVALVIQTLIFVVMIAVALGWLDWIRWSGLTLLGALTYPVYLLHVQLGKVTVEQLRDRVPHGLLLAGIAVGILVISFLIHRLVERPATPWLRTRLRASFDQVRERH